MHIVDGKYQCMRCGTIVDVPLDTIPNVVFVVSSSQRTIRSIRVDGVEVHRCDTAPINSSGSSPP